MWQWKKVLVAARKQLSRAGEWSNDKNVPGYSRLSSQPRTVVAGLSCYEEDIDNTFMFGQISRTVFGVDYVTGYCSLSPKESVKHSNKCINSEFLF